MELQNTNGLWWIEWFSNKNEVAMAVFVITIILLGVSWYKLNISNMSPPLPPGPSSLPIVGYLPFLGHDLHTEFNKMANTYGPIFKFYLGSKLHVVINTPELGKAVVREQDDTFANRDLTVAASVITYGGQDLIFSKNDPTWRNLRKIFVQEVLSNKNLKACSTYRTEEVRNTIKNVYGKIGTNIDISDIAFLTEANVIARMVWDETSYKGGNGVSLMDEFRSAAMNIAKLMGHPNLSDIFPILAWFDLQGVERNMKKEFKKMDRILTSIIEHRIQSNSKKSPDLVDEDAKKDFLQICLELMDRNDAKSLSITQIKALLSNTIIAGTETTTTFVEWAMANIVKNHKVMKRIQEELIEVVGLNNIVQESHLPKLQYLDATIKETFRLYPVSPILLPRVPSKDCLVGGYTVPKGSTVIINIVSIHRNPRYWDNPMEFNPDRFLANEGTNKWDFNGNDLTFVPFGSGRRICPGLPLALKMTMFMLASLLHSFDWSLAKGEVHDLSEDIGMILKKRKPLIVVANPRLSDTSLYM